MALSIKTKKVAKAEKGRVIIPKTIFKKIKTALRKIYIKRKVVFSECGIEDAPLLMNLYKEEGGETDDLISFAESLGAIRNWGFCLIVKYEAKVIGTVTIRKFPAEISNYKDWWVMGVLIGNRYRNLGIGLSLLKNAIQRAKREGIKELKLLVDSKSIPAITLYRKLGFKEISIPELYEELARREKSFNRKEVAMGLKI